jgi:hypothetical protein
MSKIPLSFYLDDTNPYDAPPSAFRTFLDFASSEGIAGESSLIFGYNWLSHGLISRPTTADQAAYLDQLGRAFSCGIDSHCELLTHLGRFDFAQNRMPADAIHEGLWLYEPGVTVQEYESYFGNILSEGEQVGLRFTGVTWPGCGCDACTRRYADLAAQGITQPNPNFWQALHHLAQQGRFRSRTVPCFFGGEVEQASATRMAGDGPYGVFNLPPNAADRFGLWLNSPAHVDPDYYITADGRAGRLVDLVRQRVPYILFYAHWQGLNPANGVGWPAFTQVVRRIHTHLRDEVEWVRPSEYTDRLSR